MPLLVWHGVKNVGTEEAVLLNLPTVAYAYDDPDHWRVGADSPSIPYRW